MADVWFSLIWTGIVTLVAMLSDWLAGQIVYPTSALAQIRRKAHTAATASTTGKEVSDEITAILANLAAQTRARLSFGSNLVEVAIAVDFAAFGIWLSNPDLFPFFARWNTEEQSFESTVWLLFLLPHFALLLVAYVLKHLHGTAVDLGDLDGEQNPLTWPFRNKWMLGSNMLGLATLFSTFAVVTDGF